MNTTRMYEYIYIIIFILQVFLLVTTCLHHCKVQSNGMSTSHLLNVASGLASKLYVMSLLMLIGPASTNRIVSGNGHFTLSAKRVKTF